ncbi:MAG: restriction endonuclease subunit S [Bacteroidetes bacterium]|nr:restriction endonuclease subunit S [Bacteroidota bacterium]
MELKKDFKNTEIGSVHKDWKVKSLGFLCSYINDGTHHTPNYVNKGIPFYSVENVSNDNFSQTKYISEKEHSILSKRCSPAKGDILMTRIGTLGKTKLIDWDVNASIYVSLALLKMNGLVDNSYLFNYTKSDFFINEVKKRALLNATPQKINMGEISEIPIYFPPELKEQQAIANVLSDTDQLIQNLKNLIAKKKVIKQGAMQELLTGKKRLQGFTEEWETKKLGEIAFIKTGSKNNQDKISDGNFPFFVRSQFVERINTYSYNCEAILVPGEGGIGSIFHYINGKFDVHQRVYVINDFSQNVFGKYVYLFMKEHFGTHAMKNSVKATVDSLRLPTFQEFEIKIPKDIQEQQTIAQILSDMDAEIEALEQQLQKTQTLKQGMMQELLTGKIRLLKPVAQEKTEPLAMVAEPEVVYKKHKKKI